MLWEDWLLVLTGELGSDSFFAAVNPKKSQLEQDFPTFCNQWSHFQLKWLARNPEQQVWVSRLYRASGFPCLCSFWLDFSDMPVFNLQKYCLDFTQDFRWVLVLSMPCSAFRQGSSLSSGTCSDFQASTWFFLYLGDSCQKSPCILMLGLNILDHCSAVGTQFCLLNKCRFVHPQIITQHGSGGTEADFSLLD